MLKGIKIEPCEVVIPSGETFRTQEMYYWHFEGSIFGPFDTLIEALENCKELSMGEILDEAEHLFDGSPAAEEVAKIKDLHDHYWGSKKDRKNKKTILQEKI